MSSVTEVAAAPPVSGAGRRPSPLWLVLIATALPRPAAASMRPPRMGGSAVEASKPWAIRLLANSSRGGSRSRLFLSAKTPRTNVPAEYPGRLDE